MSTPKDDYGDRHIVGAPGCLFITGAVLPALWAIWTLFTVALSNSALWGSEVLDHTYPREVPGLWVTAALLTITAVALMWILRRYKTARRPATRVLAALTAAAALANWAVLLFV